MFNEQNGVTDLVAYWSMLIKQKAIDAELIIVNDGSKDKTAFLLKECEKNNAVLRVLHHRENQGYGSALATGMQASRGGWIVFLDGDGQFDLIELERLLEKQEQTGASLVIGFRDRKKDKFIRVFANQCFTRLVNLFFNTRFLDPNCAFRICEKEKLLRLSLVSTGYSFPTEMALKFHAAGFAIEQVQVTHLPRKFDRSKLSFFTTAFKFSIFILRLRFQFIFHPPKNCLAASR